MNPKTQKIKKKLASGECFRLLSNRHWGLYLQVQKLEHILSAARIGRL